MKVEKKDDKVTVKVTGWKAYAVAALVAAAIGSAVAAAVKN